MSTTYKVTKKLFTVSQALLEDFVELEKRFVRISLHDFYMIYPGMGSVCYMSHDGRLAWDDDDMWETPWSRGDAYAAVRACMLRRDADFSFMSDVFPAKPADGNDCSYCKADGAITLNEGKLVCPMCRGLGWTSVSLNLAENVIGETVTVHDE